MHNTSYPIHISSFVDDVIFSHNKANGQNKEMAHMFCWVARWWYQWDVRRYYDVVFGWDHQVATPGAKSPTVLCLVLIRKQFCCHLFAILWFQ